MAHLIIRGENTPIPLQAHEAMKIRDVLRESREDRPEVIEIEHMTVRVSDIKMVDTKDSLEQETPQTNYWADWLELRKEWNKYTPKEKAAAHVGVFNALFRSVYGREPSIEEASRASAIRLEFFETNPRWTFDPPELYPSLVERLPKSQKYTLEKMKQRTSNEIYLAGKPEIGKLVWN